jgi:ethanolamine utilization microcompartment shell protein EutL
MFVIRAILNWLTGGGINALAQAYAAHRNAGTEDSRIKADVIKQQLDAALEAQRLAQQVRLATAGFWEMRLLTFLIAAPFVLHAGLVGIDTSLNAIDLDIPSYPSPFSEWEGAILLSFFGLHALGKGVTAIAAAFTARR